MTYQLKSTKRFDRKIKKLDVRYVRNIRERVDKLAENPRPNGCKKLVGVEDTYRIRIGNYRVIYHIRDAELIVLALDVDHRSQIYENN